MKTEPSLFGKNLFGEDIKRKPTGPLSERFLFPPFSVFDARAGEWRKRKRAWLRLGIKSEIGRSQSGVNNQSEMCLTLAGGFENHLAHKNKFGKCFNIGDKATWEKSKSSQKYGVNAHLDTKTQKALGCFAAYGDTAVNRGQGSATGTSIFDPVLCEIIYRWFCPAGGQIVDPFAGGSVRGIVAAMMGLKYWGCDLRQEQIEANYEQKRDILKEDDHANMNYVKTQDNLQWICGDAVDLVDNAPQADLVFTCPPYGDLEIYSDNPRDLSTMEYHTFMPALKRIMFKAVQKLKPQGFACMVVGDFRDRKTGNYRGFVADVIHAFREFKMQLYNEAILITPAGSLPIRISNQFDKNLKLGKTHQNVLIFRK